ncbi:histidine--tRNA ligase [Lysinibacillus sp. BW-2-10]|uniref:histidine--tRNA ligase n=1 Tax=Lysinibacillus sp. BW-2-10 TaxID=2590030 RepID=UPI00117D6E5D|nr:histidine--tRNA ligase [Lysinibacillus sp. BW-2-10]TSI05310.1 histidine--tRNA ligase [Lysinibacillus sp. BW-2-10]
MKKMDYQNVRGTQDYLPQEEMIRRKIRRTLEDTFIQYGCKPLETPILNYTELMSSKYAGGAEILQEMYTLTDRGERDLALRYDLTIPFAKVVAMNPTISMPFKRYEIGKVFRDGPIKAGRFREFTQCDVDIVGVSSQVAEAELMMMALHAFKKLEMDVVIQYNNRKLLAGMLEAFETPLDRMNKVVLVLDKIEKVGVNQVLVELAELELSDQTVKNIEGFLLSKDNKQYAYFEPYAAENEQAKEGLAELIELDGYLNYLGIPQKCIFNPFLARGLEIYTGTIYEIFLENQLIKSSIGSGGRYDNAIGGLIGSTESFSTVGISFGLDVIYTALSMEEKQSNKNDIDIYIIPIGTLKQSLYLATKLREEGYKVELEMGNRKISKAMDKANKEDFPLVIVLGEREVGNNQYKLKDMETGEETIKKFVF